MKGGYNAVCPIVNAQQTEVFINAFKNNIKDIKSFHAHQIHQNT